MAMSADERTGVGAERLHWSVVLGGRSHTLDLYPPAFGHSVGVQVDGRPMARIPKPTPQIPWREGAVQIEGDRLLVGLTWHFPVMRTDVFVDGRSLLDGRSLESVRADAPAALTNYEVWLGAQFGGSPSRDPRFWPLVILASAGVWIAALVASPIAPAFRGVVGVAMGTTGVVLLVGWLWYWGAFAGRVYLALLARPQLGDSRRVVLWFGAFIGYGVGTMAVAGGLLVLLAQWTA